MKKKTLKILSLILFFFAIPIQSQNYHFMEFSLDDGLPQSQVNDVIQDEKGYLWIATNGGGIARFDGVYFDTWNENNGLRSNYINCLSWYDDSLYIGTQQGLSIKKEDEIFSYLSPKINGINHLGEGVYLSTNKGVRLFFDLKVKLVEIDSVLDASKIFDIHFDNANLFIASELGLWKVENFNTQNQKIIKLLDAPSQKIISLKNDLLIVINNQGLYTVSKNSGESILINTTKNISEIIVRNNQIWLSSKKEGIQVLDKNDFKLVKTIRDASHDNLIINKIIEDDSSNPWLASDRGLFKLIASNFKVNLKGNIITAIHNSKDKIFVATSDGGLVYLDSTGVNRVPNFHKNIYALNSTVNGQLLAGTDAGILVLDSLVVKDTIDIVKDVQKIIVEKNQFWVGSTTSGIKKFTYKTDSIGVVDSISFKKSDGLYDMNIIDMRLDSNGILWYVSQQSNIGYIENNVVHHLGVKIPNNVSVNSLEIKDNKIYLGTQGLGIWWSNTVSKHRFRRLRGMQSLKSNNIYQLHFDNQNNLWSGTQKGVEQIIINNKNLIESINYFGKNDGFESLETMQNVIDSDVYGNIWFGTIDGLIKFEPAIISSEYKMPTVSFNNVEVVYHAIDSVSNYTNTELILAPDDNHISFSFQSIDINYPNEIEYRHQLNNEGWSEWSRNTSVVFADIRPGHYIFSAQSKVGNKLSEPIVFNYFVETKLVDKFWFRLSVIGGLLLIVVLLIINYIQKLKRRNNARQKHLKLENKLLILEQKALQLQMNPHFVFNVLNGLKGLGATDLNEMNKVILDFANLLRALLNNSRKQLITLEEEALSLSNYLSLEQSMNVKAFNFDIIFDEKISKQETMIPPMLIQPFVENSIQHGIQKISKKGMVLIEFKVYNNELLCSIIDNGIGVETSLKYKKHTGRKSMAIEVTQERIEAHYPNNKFKIEQINEESKINGTKVSFRLPYLTEF